MRVVRLVDLVVLVLPTRMVRAEHAFVYQGGVENYAIPVQKASGEWPVEVSMYDQTFDVQAVKS